MRKISSHQGPPARVLVMDGRIQSCLPILKALRLAGHHVTIAESDPLCVGFFSRYPQRRIRHRDPRRDPEGFLSDLIDHLSTGDYDVLIPIVDVTAELVSKYKPLLERLVRIPLVNYPIFMRGRDKSQTMKIARAQEIPTPTTFFPDEMEIEEIARMVDYPVFIKPNISMGARGLTMVKNPLELKELYPLVVARYGPSTIQEFIPQTDFQYKAQLFIDNHYTVKACIICKKIRHYPPSGGSGTLFVTIKRDDIAKIGENLLSAMGWYGYGDIDLITDPRDNVIKIMEVNPRISAPVKICFEAGIDIADMLVKLAMGHEIPSYDDYKDGVYLRHEGLDFLWFLESAKRFNTQPSWFWFFGNNLKYQISSLDDPAPIIAYLLANLRDLFSLEARRFKYQRTFLI